MVLTEAIDPIKLRKKLSDNEIVFYKNREGVFILSADDIQNTDNLYQLPWKKTVVIPPSEAFDRVVHHLFENPIILIEDDSDKPIGYLQASKVLQQIYQSYQYLQAYFETMIETMDASVSIIDNEGRTVVWTKGAEQIFSVKQEEIVGRSMSDFFPHHMLEVLNSLETGKSLYHHQHQPRSDLFVLINTNPIRLNGEIIGALAAETDITNVVRLNQELFHATSKVHQLQKEMTKLNPSHDPFEQIKGNSPAIRKTMDKIKKVGSTDATSLIVGESGVGKELFARAIHNIREPADAPYIALNCGAIPESLFESELFGYEKGAFSGANQKGKKGKIELARGGTLFLDEIGEMPLEMQVKLLRVLEEKKYFPVGGTKLVDADCHIVAATNRDLQSLVKEGKFREDLFYRLNVVTIKIPPLRERKEDILELTHLFLHEFSVRYNRLIQEVPQTVMQHLLQYDWPGNVRELRNTIERLVVFSSNGSILEEDLPFSVDPNEQTMDDVTFRENSYSLSLQQEVDLYEKKVIMKTLEAEKGNKMETAKRLGVSRATLYNKMKKLQIPMSSEKSE